jgi:hypothetical protein
MQCLRIYADESGASHFADIDIPLVSMERFPGVPAISLSAWFTATAVRFAWVPAGMRMADWHTPPVRQLVVWLTGWVEFETSDGEVRRCDPGAVVLVEDTCGRGHISRHPEEGQFVMVVPVPDGLAVP